MARRYRKRGFLTKKAAQIWKNQHVYNKEKRRIGLPGDDNSLVVDVIERFSEEGQAGKKISSIGNTNNHLQHWIRFFHEKRILHIYEIRRSHVLDYKRWGKSQLTYKGTPPSDTTVNHELKTIRQCFNWAYEWEIIMENPVPRVALYKVPKPNLPRYLTVEEIAIIEKAAK